MEATVLAGTIEFSPAEIALVLAVLTLVPAAVAGALACWGVAVLLHRSARVDAGNAASGEGWGR